MHSHSTPATWRTLRRVVARLPWHPHRALPLLPTAQVARLLHVVRSPGLRLALMAEFELRRGTDRDTGLGDCPSCGEALDL